MNNAVESPSDDELFVDQWPVGEKVYGYVSCRGDFNTPGEGLTWVAGEEKGQMARVPVICIYRDNGIGGVRLAGMTFVGPGEGVIFEPPPEWGVD